MSKLRISQLRISSEKDKRKQVTAMAATTTTTSTTASITPQTLQQHKQQHILNLIANQMR
jgi:hypothetical protein